MENTTRDTMGFTTPRSAHPWFRCPWWLGQATGWVGHSLRVGPYGATQPPPMCRLTPSLRHNCGQWPTAQPLGPLRTCRDRFCPAGRPCMPVSKSRNVEFVAQRGPSLLIADASLSRPGKPFWFFKSGKRPNADTSSRTASASPTRATPFTAAGRRTNPYPLRVGSGRWYWPESKTMLEPMINIDEPSISHVFHMPYPSNIFTHL